MGAPIDIHDQRFGRWLVLRLAGSDHGKRTWLCRCDCGVERAVPASALRNGTSSSCGCKRLDDLSGLRFGRYTVLHRSANGRNGVTRWFCRCDCGIEKSVVASALRSGIVVSCNCLKRERLRTHGLSKHPLYSTWKQMMLRCYDRKCHAYSRYGARGISVCIEWKLSIQQFITDMGPRVPPTMELDRINNNGNYEPNNCRWATPREQANNRRSNRLVAFNGKLQSIMAWERETGINRRTITQRLNKGLSVEESLTRKVQ